MSTRMRIARTALYVLTFLASGSIVSACFLGASAIGPNRAFAQTPEPTVGALGVGERTIAPLTAAVSASDKVAAEPSANASAVVALAVPSLKVASPRTARHASTTRTGRTPAARRMTAVTIGTALLRGWKRARCSWYGPGFYGRTMAGGGRLRHGSMVVAHKRLPFGTRVQFWHKGRTVTAVVQDRGPYISGRVFDLGPGTAKALGFTGVGTLRYRILGKG